MAKRGAKPKLEPGERIEFFESAAAFRAWLKKNHAAGGVCRVGYYKKAHAAKAGVATLTWEESIREALCFGWIDGVRHTLDEGSYTVRFTPRRARSKWSAVNIRQMEELEAAGKLAAAGRAAFEARPDKDSKGYSAQRKDAALAPAMVRAFKAKKSAWAFLEAQPPGYKRMMAWWVMQAKQEATREKRLARVIEASARGDRVG